MMKMTIITKEKKNRKKEHEKTKIVDVKWVWKIIRHRKWKD